MPHDFSRPLNRYVKLRVVHVAGMPGTFSPPPLQRNPPVSNPGMHHGTCVTHMPRCMSGSQPVVAGKMSFLYLNCTFWYGRQHIIAREDFSDCILSGHRQRVHWTEKCILNRQNHNGNHMTANAALSNIIISFVKCTILYLFWYQYEF